MNQYDFVETCLSKYKWESLPFGQQWEEAHFPLPECLGGTETIWLWSCDHSLQGLLQSDEFNHPCLHGYAYQKDLANLQLYYSEYVSKLEFWIHELRVRAFKSLTPQQRSERNRKANLNRSVEFKRGLGKSLGSTGLGGKAHAEKTRKGVIGVSPLGREYLFTSMREAETFSGVGRGLIRRCCNGKQPLSKGWSWKFA